MKKEQKLRIYYFGFIAEMLAACYLRCKFYQIIARKFKSPFGEIDIIARKGKHLIFIEVKARKDISQIDFISRRQQNRINKAAEYFIVRNPKYQKFLINFDAIIMNRFFLPIHFKNYW